MARRVLVKALFGSAPVAAFGPHGCWGGFGSGVSQWPAGRFACSNTTTAGTRTGRPRCTVTPQAAPLCFPCWPRRPGWSRATAGRAHRPCSSPQRCRRRPGLHDLRHLPRRSTVFGVRAHPPPCAWRVGWHLRTRTCPHPARASSHLTQPALNPGHQAPMGCYCPGPGDRTPGTGRP